MVQHTELRSSGRDSEHAFFESLPIHRIFVEVNQIETSNRRILVFNSLLGCCIPFVRGRNPQSLRECLRRAIALETSSRGGQKGIHRWFINITICRVTLALYRPIISRICFCDKINSCILTAKLIMMRKFAPQPHLFEKMNVKCRCPQISLHQALKTKPFVFLRKRFLTEFI